MENEVRLIDGNKAEAVLLNIADHLKEAGNTDLYPAAYTAADVIKQQRTINPESLRPKGQWIVNRRHTVSKNPYLDDNYHIDVICSECSFCIQAENASFGFPEPIKTNYCPNCGANMKEETECPKM